LKALDGFQVGEPTEHKIQRNEPPRPQKVTERLKEIKQRRSGIDLSS
jgi:hypothetical protein